MSSLQKALQSVIADVRLNWTAEQRVLAETIAEDYAQLISRQIAGENVIAELAEVRAQAQSILAASQLDLASALELRIKHYFLTLLAELVPGA